MGHLLSHFLYLVMKSFINPSLLPYNTFKITASCQQLIELETDEEVKDIVYSNFLSRNNFYLIGDGSNTLFQHDFDGVILKMATSTIALTHEDEHSVILTVDAGVKWEDFIHYCIEHSYYGVENLVAIPGLVGSSPVQNIGAYGVEVKDVICSVSGYLIKEKRPFTLSRSECHFGYRTSIFKTSLKNNVIITNVAFQLSKSPHFNLSYQGLSQRLVAHSRDLTLKLLTETIRQIRNEKLPDLNRFGCAGSFFKNPIVSRDKYCDLAKHFDKIAHYPINENETKLSAGFLIEKAGLKGYRVGDVGVWDKQALVIVNYGAATGEEVCRFYKEIQKTVNDKFGVALEPEINIL